MYRHVIMVWLRDPHPQAIEALCVRLRCLLGVIRGLQSLLAQPNDLSREDACHLLLELLFDCEASARGYLTHPLRLSLLQETRPLILRTAGSGYAVAQPKRQPLRLYASAGPSCDDADTLSRLMDAGMHGIRLGMTDDTPDVLDAFLDTFHRVAASHRTSPELLLDNVPSDALAATMQKTGATGLIITLPPQKDARRDLRAGIAGARLVAKVASEPALATLAETIADADEVLVARNALSRSHPRHSLPALQADIAAAALDAGKPYMVASGLLLSMCDRPFPMVSELSDIHSAVRGGATSLMLNRETSIGRFPVEAMATLRQTAQYASQALSPPAPGQSIGG